MFLTRDIYFVNRVKNHTNQWARLRHGCQSKLSIAISKKENKNIFVTKLLKSKQVAMRKAFLEKHDLTLTQLLDIARANEAAERQANVMEAKFIGYKDECLCCYKQYM